MWTPVTIPMSIAPYPWADPFTWTARFSYRLTDNSLDLKVKVFFKGATDKQVTKWEKVIERIWSDKAALTDGDTVLPISLNLVSVSKAKKADHKVKVIQRDGYGTGIDKWFAKHLDNKTVAHEFGHMIGAPDEYEWGATIQVREGTLMAGADTRTKIIMPDYFDVLASAVGASWSPVDLEL